MVIYLVYIAVALLYAYMIFWIFGGWTEIPETYYQEEDDRVPHQFSIIIAARDEQDTIKSCLESIANQRYAADVQVILVDDHSTDETSRIASDFTDVLVLNQEKDKEGKKAALLTGIEQAKHSYIITVDADCTFHMDWLRLIDQKLHDDQADLLVGPVVMTGEANWLMRAQYLDVAATMSATANGIRRNSYFLANGANLIYKRSMFYAVGGFEGNADVASGDDVFLIDKIAKSHGSRIGYLKSERAAARTMAEPTLRSLLRQRVRWASKTKAYASGIILAIQAFTFLVAMMLLSGFTIGLVIPPAFFGAVMLLFVKATIDFMFLSQMVTFFKGKKIMKGYLLSQFAFLLYILFMGYVAITGKKSSWKGR